MRTGRGVWGNNAETAAETIVVCSGLETNSNEFPVSARARNVIEVR